MSARDRVERLLGESGRRRRGAGILVSLAALALVTGAIYICKSFVPVLSLGVLYLLAVLPVAVLFGRAYAISVAFASAALFNFLFLPPLYTLRLSNGEHWFALAVYLVVGIVASDLAVRARQRAQEAEQRGREEGLLAQLATAFLQAESAASELERFSPAIAGVLNAESARIVLGRATEPPVGESPLQLDAGGRRLGTLFIREGAESNLAIRRRFLPALSSLVAVAIDRERLAQEAVEAEALRRSDTIKTAVLQAVSHDLRSPLTAIRVAAESLENPALSLDDEDRSSLLETVRLEVERLERVVDNLLDLSRLQAGAADPNRELWAVEELLGQALDQLGAAAGRVELALPADAPVVEVDAIQIERVLVNLLENALKFSQEDEAVHVRVTTTRSEVLVRIVDRGPGIPEAELERIFEPFGRAPGSEDRGGSGLGLAIAKGFAEGNGGRVWAESRQGQGASFVLALPLVEGASRCRDVSGTRVLVVDDEPQILRALQTTLRGAGYDVEAAASAAEALTKAAIHPPEAVILDLVLPDRSGVEVCRELRSWSQAPILILSAVGEEGEKVAALDAGADDYVTKPFGVEELLARLRAALRRAGPSSEPTIEVGALRIDLDKHAVSRGGEPIRLTPHEFGMLRLFAQNEGKLLTHRTILREVWGPAYQVESHYLHVYVSQLRRKIEPEPTRPRYILTEPGAGYRFVAPGSDP